MATITATKIQGSGSQAITVTTAGASDTLTFTKGSGQILVINNITAGALTPNIVGDAATTVVKAGVGTITVSGGYDFPSIAAGAYKFINLDTISDYLTGDIALTGADGCELALLYW